MRVAVITCNAYRDAHGPFMALFHRFWPDCPYPVTMHADMHREPWCATLLRIAKEAGEEAVLLMMEDFWLNEPVRQNLVEYALDQLNVNAAGCVRLYPCPGADVEYGDPYFGLIPHGTPYRISCQAGIWSPAYLAKVAAGSMTTTSEAGDFENIGGPFADTLPDKVLSFKRDVQPWPIHYLSTAITRGLWEPAAIELCELHGIALDRSMRGMVASIL